MPTFIDHVSIPVADFSTSAAFYDAVLATLGMQRRKVLWLFVLETGLLGLLGCSAGAVVAVLVAGGLNLAEISLNSAITA